MEKIELRRARDYGLIVNDTFAFLKQNWKPLFKSIFTICGFFILTTLAATILNQINVFGSVTGGQVSYSRIFGLSYFVTLLFSVISYSMVGLCTFCYIILYVEKEKEAPTVSEVWSYVKYFFGRYILTQFLMMLITGIVFFVCAFFGAAIGAFMGIYFVFCVMLTIGSLAIYLFPVMSIMQGMIVFENATLGYVFDRSFKLIKSNWWITFGAFAVLFIVIFLMMMVLVVPSAFFANLQLAMGGTGTYMPFIILGAVLKQFIQVVACLFYIGTAMAYYSLVEKKEAKSLLDKVDAIGQEVASTDLSEEQY